MVILGWKFLINRIRVKVLSKLRNKEKEKNYRMDIQYNAAKYLLASGNDKEKEQIYEWLKENDISPFPYSFIEKYKDINIDVKYDKACDCFYTIRNGRKM